MKTCIYVIGVALFALVMDGCPNSEYCQGTCFSLGSLQCNNDLLQICSETPDGCLVWQDQQDCAKEGQVCHTLGDQTRCTCLPNCSFPDILRCNDDVLQICREDPGGCLEWQDQQDCASEGQVCQVLYGSLQCVCLRNCFGRECGPDECGGVCSPGCPNGTACDNEGHCETVCLDECEPTNYPTCEGVNLLTCALQEDGCYDLINSECPADKECQGEVGSANCETIIPDLPRPTHLFALPKGPGKVHLGWRMISMYPELGYNVYRSTTQGGPYEKLNTTPISDETNFRDTTVANGVEYFYVVRLVNETGRESPNSLEARVTADSTDSGEYIRFTDFNCHPKVDNWCEFKFGDVDGDGIPEFLQPCQNTLDPTQKLHVAVFDRYGTRLWLHENVGDKVGGAMPWTFVDLDQDGRDEVVGVIFKKADNDIRVVAYNGLTGEERYRSKPIASNPNSCIGKGTSFLSPAMLDGKSWSVVVETCNTYDRERTVAALGTSLQIQWKYILPAYTLPGGAYTVRGADMDGDGKDEVLFGGSILDSDGSVIHEFPWKMVSGIRVGDIRPDLPGLEVFYFNKDRFDPDAVLSTTKSVLWKRDEVITSICEKCGKPFNDDVRQGRSGWIGEVDINSPGLECFASYYWNPICPNPDCHFHINKTKWANRLYSSTGKVLKEQYLPSPIDWDGKLPLETKSPPGAGIKEFLAADVIGDYREEFIVMISQNYGTPPHTLLVVTNTSFPDSGLKKPSPWEKRDYVIDKRWTGYR